MFFCVLLLLFCVVDFVCCCCCSCCCLFVSVFESQNGLGPLAVGSRRKRKKRGEKIKWGVEREDLKSLWSVRANEVIVNGTQDEAE